MTKPVKDRFTVKEKSWIMYDWANSVYATNIMAAIFPTIFVSMVGAEGDRWWSLGTSLATFLVALLAPLLGAVADFKGMKKKLFTVFLMLGAVFTALIAATNSWKLMLVFYVLSRIGFAGSNLFYDSFLTDVTTNDRMDRVSSWGYAMGYIGGSTIPFVLSIAALVTLGYSSPIAQKFSILITSLWWIAFSIPFLKNVRQEHYIEKTTKNSALQAFRNIGRTFREIFQVKGLLYFIIAYFFYIDGVGTVISISTAYGTVLGLGSIGMILALLVTQIVAMPCSILFARISAKITARKALIVAIILYTVICLVGFYMGYSLEPHQDALESAIQEEFVSPLSDLSDEDAIALRDSAAKLFTSSDAKAAFDTEAAKLLNESRQNPELERVAALFADFLGTQLPKIQAYQNAVSLSTILFWAMAVLVGTVQGGIQAVSRSYFGKLIPKERSNEFFGFFDIFGKFASVIGPALYSLIGHLTGRSSFGVLSLAALFLIGLCVMVFGKTELMKLEKQAEP